MLENIKIPSLAVSQSSTPQSKPPLPQMLKLAALKVEKILRAFPDYGKSPPEYIASLVQIMAVYPAHIQDRIADLHYGIPAKSEFLPTVKAVAEMGDKLTLEERERVKFNERFQGRPIDKPERTLFRPFPQLWAEFGSEFMDSLVGKGVTFDRLDNACKTLVQHGKDAALTILDPTHKQSQAA